MALQSKHVLVCRRQQVTWRPLTLVSQKEESVCKQEPGSPCLHTLVRKTPIWQQEQRQVCPGTGTQVLVCPDSVSSVLLRVVNLS